MVFKFGLLSGLRYLVISRKNGISPTKFTVHWVTQKTAWFMLSASLACRRTLSGGVEGETYLAGASSSNTRKQARVWLFDEVPVAGLFNEHKDALSSSWRIDSP